MDYHGALETITIANIDEWTDIKNATGSLIHKEELEGFDTTSTSDKLIATEIGHYAGTYNITGQGTNNNVYATQIAHNESDTLGYTEFKFLGASASGPFPGSFFLTDVAVGDTIGLQVKNLSGASDFGLKALSWWIWKVHP